MPVQSNEKVNLNPAKYILYYCESFGGTYKRSYRTIIQNFRTQMKGLGAGSATYLQQNINGDVPKEDLKKGMFVKILDGTKFFEETYTSVGDEIFIGTIKSVTTDILQGSPDRQGSIILNEMGDYLSTIPINWTSKEQIFNPIVEGKCYGNRKESTNQFETNIADMAVTTEASSKFPLGDENSHEQENKRVWSLEGMLRFMGSAFGFDIKFPWEVEGNLMEADREAELANQKPIDPTSPNFATLNAEREKNIVDINNKWDNAVEKNEKDYGFFKNTLEVRSYSSFQGKSVPQMLNELLDEPFSYRISYISTAYPTYEIINKSIIAVDEFCPIGYLQKKVIDNSIIVNLNITEDAEVYDKVIYRGNNLLFCGTITPWVANSGYSVVPDWTTTNELQYTYGGEEVALEEGIAAAFRQEPEIEDVYRKFKFAHMNDGSGCYFQIPKSVDEKTKIYKEAPFYPTESGTATMVPFLPQVDFVEYSNTVAYILPTPKLQNSLGVHKTPPQLFFKWAEKLPFENSNGKKKEPFVIATIKTTDADISHANSVFFVDLTKAGGGYDTASITFLMDGLKLNMAVPETLAFNDDLLFAVGESSPKTSKQPWKSDYVSPRNPETTNYTYGTSWEATAMTVAAYSDQKLEWSITNLNSKTTNRIKIIEDPSLECHIVHAGTIKKLRQGPYELAPVGVNRAASTNGFERFQKDTFIRNDFKKLLGYAKQAANWLFQEKRAIRLENHLQLYTVGSWNVGDIVSSVVDEKVTHTINTCVESVEYDVMSNRVYIATAFAQMPEFKRLRQQPISVANIAPTTDTKAPTIGTTQKVITIDPQPTTGVIVGGAGGSSTSSKNYSLLILGGNVVDGISCVTASVPTSGAFVLSAELPSADSADVLPDGVGRAWLYSFSNPVTNGDGLQSPDGGLTGRVFVINWNNEIGNYPLVAGTQVPTYSSKTLTYPNGENTKTYKAYVPSWR